MNSWKELMPEYELVLWDTKRFDVTTNQFVAEACRVKKWAFAADYIRLYALYTEGGIYLDVDVIVKKSFDEFLQVAFFSSIEYYNHTVKKNNSHNLLNENGSVKKPFSKIPGIGIQAAVMGSTKGHPFLKDCMEHYENKRFVLDNGELNKRILAPVIYSMAAEKFGFRYVNERQILKNGMLMLPSVTFAANTNQARDESYAIHLCNGSWRIKNKPSFYRFAKDNISDFFSEDINMWLKRQRNALKNYSMDPEAVFTKIYQNNRKLYFTNTLSIDPSIELYKKVLKEFIKKNDIKRIFEIGCGDYQIMKSILSSSDISYIGSDVVKQLIEDLSKINENRKRTFIHLDVVNGDPLPEADLCVINQVLQHLSNRQILKILKKTRRYKYVIITEQLPINPTSINMNKVTGLGIRMSKHSYSGVYLSEPPFSSNFKTLLTYRNDYKDIPAVMTTVLIQNS
ncbi:MAG: mannosyltransferase OCH1-like enzyme [Cyclobacteriaceae bacterium]|jgi:mannosyltransferase OCH1-like enzyme